MFGSSKKKFKPARIDTVLGARVRVRGDIEFVGGLHIDGVVEGNVIGVEDDPNAVVILSEHSEVTGDVRVSNVVINGKITGDVYASGRLELHKMTRVTGTVRYGTMEMQMGAEVNGQLLRMDSEADEASSKTDA